MRKHQLSFAQITILRKDIAEVVVNDGVEMTLSMVDEYHQFLLSHLSPPFSLLINKINSYSYSFEAQNKLAVLDEINVMAVVSYNPASKKSTRALKDNIHRDIKWNLAIFNDRESALLWVESEQHKIKHRHNQPATT